MNYDLPWGVALNQDQRLQQCLAGPDFGFVIRPSPIEDTSTADHLVVFVKHDVSTSGIYALLTGAIEKGAPAVLVVYGLGLLLRVGGGLDGGMQDDIFVFEDRGS